MREWLMPWEWVGSVATAVVGLGGIAGTWLTARAGRLEQRELLRVQLDEAHISSLRDIRRQVFADLSADLSSLISYSQFVNVSDEDLVSAIHALSRSHAQVQLLGSSTVNQLADQTVTAAMRYAAALLEEHDKADIKPLQAEVKGRIFLLHRLMAADLGITLEMSPGEVAKDIKTLDSAMQFIAESEAKQGDQKPG